MTDKQEPGRVGKWASIPVTKDKIRRDFEQINKGQDNFSESYRSLIESTPAQEATGEDAAIYKAIADNYRPTAQEPAQRLSDDAVISMIDSAGIRVDPEAAFAIVEMVERAICPPGHVVAPVEPTEAMLAAGGKNVLRLYYSGMKEPDDGDIATARSAYRAMIAAAPKGSA